MTLDSILEFDENGEVIDPPVTVELPVDDPPLPAAPSLSPPEAARATASQGSGAAAGHSLVEAATEVTDALDLHSLTMSQLGNLGRVFAQSGYFGRMPGVRPETQTVAQAITKVAYGQEIGVPPVTAMQQFHVIQGKPAMSAQLLGYLVQRSGRFSYRIRETTDTRCVLIFRERETGGWEVLGESEFTLADAKRAKLTGNPSWTTYPKAMLFARAMSQGVRTYCPVITGGAVYVPEELGLDDGEAAA